jgi:hypothetical protein
LKPIRASSAANHRTAFILEQGRLLPRFLSAERRRLSLLTILGAPGFDRQHFSYRLNFEKHYTLVIFLRIRI